MNQIKAQAHAVASRSGSGRWGLVCNTRSTDTGYEVRVKLQPEDVMTGWLPVLSPMVGTGWGIVSPPALNMQAFVVPHEGRADHGVVVGMAFNVQDMPPQPGGNAVSEGQFALVHKNGSYLLFNDDDVVLVTNRDLTATVGRDLTATVTGNATVKAQAVNLNAPTLNADNGSGGKAQWILNADVHVKGDVFDAHGSIDRMRQAYDAHQHPGIQPGLGTTGTTTRPDAE